VIKVDLLWIINDFAIGKTYNSRLNYALIVLIPKISGANNVYQFGPISLLNGSSQIMMKKFGK